MLNPLIDNTSINTNEQIKNEEKDKSQNISDDCSWCIFCDFSCLFMCCLE